LFVLIHTMPLQYFAVYKPFAVLCQFSPVEKKATLKDFFPVPTDVYPVGRLDFDSEGLLLLSNDKSLNHRLLDPGFAHEREYWVQVEGDISNDALSELSKGITISVDGVTHKTKPAKAERFSSPPPVPDRNPPIRFRKHIPDTWIKLILKEGKNRQVRKMTAKVGYPTLRLIRTRIEKLSLDNMQPGDMISLSRERTYELLFGK